MSILKTKNTIMKKVILSVIILASIVSFTSCTKESTDCRLLAGCNKEKGSDGSNKDIEGIWILKGTSGVGPGGKLVFFERAGTNTISFDCSGSPGPGWPLKVETPYKFENNKLSYIDYERPANGYFQVTSFKWVVQDKEFSVKFHQVLLYVNSDYIVNYIKQ